MKTPDIAKIRQLLGKAKIILRTKSDIHRPEPLVKPTWMCIKQVDYTDLEITIYQALALLPCETCGGSGCLAKYNQAGDLIVGDLCPDCQPTQKFNRKEPK